VLTSTTVALEFSHPYFHDLVALVAHIHAHVAAAQAIHETARSTIPDALPLEVAPCLRQRAGSTTFLTQLAPAEAIKSAVTVEFCHPTINDIVTLVAYPLTRVTTTLITHQTASSAAPSLLLRMGRTRLTECADAEFPRPWTDLEQLAPTELTGPAIAVEIDYSAVNYLVTLVARHDAFITTAQATYQTARCAPPHMCGHVTLSCCLERATGRSQRSTHLAKLAPATLTGSALTCKLFRPTVRDSVACVTDLHTRIATIRTIHYSARSAVPCALQHRRRSKLSQAA